MPADLIETVARELRSWGVGPQLWRGADSSRGGLGPPRCIVAVSGGADSVALLRALAEILPRDQIAVAHFHHGLRGAESDMDAAFTEELARRLGMTFRQEHWDRAAASGPSEEEARLARYGFLERAAEQAEAGFIATGHTASDQVETILHHLLRGTGLRGLRGIPASRLFRSGSPIRLIRPLFHVTREEVEGWLQAVGQPWRTDSSNATADFTRNRLRAELLPYLRREFQPRIDDLLGRLGEQAGEIFDHLQREARTLLAAATLHRQPNEVRLDAVRLVERGAVLLREALVELWSDLDWPRQEMTQAHWHRAAAVATGDLPAADMPDGVRVERRGNLLLLRRTPFHGT